MTRRTGIQCAATDKRGRRCRQIVKHEGEFCYSHDPALAEVRKINQQKAVETRKQRTQDKQSAIPRAERMDHIFDQLEEAFVDAQSGYLDLERAQAMAVLAEAMMKIHAEWPQRT